jgi:hypothetical protein
MTKIKFILRCAGYAVGKVAGLVLALWLVQGYKTTHPIRYSPIESDRYYASDFAPKKRWYYYQLKDGKTRQVYCLALISENGCLYAEYGNASQRKLIHCGTFKIIDR